VDDAELDAYLDRMRVSWTRLPAGRVYDAAAVNDPQSTELVRRQLAADGVDVIQPLLYLREDRRGRTAVFFRYLASLAEQGVVEQVRVVGGNAQLFDRRASLPVVTHDEESETPTQVLDATLSDGWPVILMGNTVSAFIQQLVAVSDERSVDGSPDEIGAVSGHPG